MLTRRRHLIDKAPVRITDYFGTLFTLVILRNRLTPHSIPTVLRPQSHMVPAKIYLTDVVVEPERG